MTESRAGATERLARFVAGLTFEAVPGEVVDRAEQLALDFAGCIVRGGAARETPSMLFAALERLGLAGNGAAGVVGSDRLFAPPVAALVQSVLGHSLDFDDTHARSATHPTAAVLPAVLAAGDLIGATGRQKVVALVAGYEVMTRLGLALDPDAHYRRGFHPTATCGALGAAAAVASLLALDTRATAGAFAIAAAQAAGSMQYVRSCDWTKRWQVGCAAMNGVTAACLAAEGWPAGFDAIEGEPGFLASHSEAPDARLITAGLGRSWETLSIGVKPWACCRYAHAAIDGLLQLRADGLIGAKSPVRITIGLSETGLRLCGAPIEAKRRVRSIAEAQLSMPFLAALALDEGDFGYDSLARAGDPCLEALADRIDTRIDERLAARGCPLGASITVHSAETTFERIVEEPSGEPKHFPSLAKTMQKFMMLAEPMLGASASSLAESFRWSRTVRQGA